ncbi:MAG: sugar isomerase domain-containing protein [Firmicutes bacterium]|nr:sugar isomerase domain-containing protein [Bacillota bacterium]
MLGRTYGEELRKLLDQIDRTQYDAIRKAAAAVADCLMAGGCFHLLDTGHMLMTEAVGRAGGLMLVAPVKVDVTVENPTRPRPGVGKKRVYLDEIAGLPEFILARSNIVSGDVFLISSVSGKNVLPVELALRAQAMGVKVIGLTSVAYSKALTPEHPSGKRLCEVADIVIDNCGVVGDAVVRVEGMDAPICPTSGITAAYIWWQLEAEIVEALRARGVTPHVYLSNHVPGADEYNRKALSEFAEAGI